VLTWTLEKRRDRFTALILAIVKQSINWRRNKENPLTRGEIEELNPLLSVRFKILELHNEAFLLALATPAAPIHQICRPRKARQRRHLCRADSEAPRSRLARTTAAYFCI
jgi:hypothetical protein